MMSIESNGRPLDVHLTSIVRIRRPLCPLDVMGVYYSSSTVSIVMYSKWSICGILPHLRPRSAILDFVGAENIQKAGQSPANDQLYPLCPLDVQYTTRVYTITIPVQWTQCVHWVYWVHCVHWTPIVSWYPLNPMDVHWMPIGYPLDVHWMSIGWWAMSIPRTTRPIVYRTHRNKR